MTQLLKEILKGDNTRKYIDAKPPKILLFICGDEHVARRLITDTLYDWQYTELRTRVFLGLLFILTIGIIITIFSRILFNVLAPVGLGAAIVVGLFKLSDRIIQWLFNRYNVYTNDKDDK